MENNHKRKCRKLSDDTKKKISDALKDRKLSEEHKKKISKSLTEYWKTVPYE